MKHDRERNQRIMIEEDALLTLPKGFQEMEPQFRVWFEGVNGKVHATPKTIKAVLFYLLALVYCKKVTMSVAGSAFSVTQDSVSRKLHEVIEVLKKEKIINL